MNNIGPEQILEMCYQIIATDVREIHGEVAANGASVVTDDVTKRVLDYVRALVPASKEERELANAVAELGK